MAQGRVEADWRTPAGRAYYALFIESRDALLRWGFTIPPRDNVHHFVRLRFALAALPELKQVGGMLDTLCQFRNRADYKTAVTGQFGNNAAAQQAVKDGESAIALLDQIEADAARRAAAVAAIQATIKP
jgi:hypothetical protein